MNSPRILFAILATLLFSGFGRSGEVGKLKVFVPVLPYEYLFERIGGEWIEVKAIVQEGGDCHNYSPSPRQITELSQADLLFSGGLTFESNFFIASGDNGPKEFDLLEGLDLLEGTCSECASAAAEGKEPHHEHEHEHEENDAHVWLS
ncbi:MAG: zinc ABC transporter substrate-binding protein, partial [Verrucomicrobiae bacterium]|nr:zinc ABC transporter substrate-binding protein [Verrucomicrobiae bacterium]